MNFLPSWCMPAHECRLSGRVLPTLLNLRPERLRAPYAVLTRPCRLIIDLDCCHADKNFELAISTCEVLNLFLLASSYDYPNGLFDPRNSEHESLYTTNWSDYLTYYYVNENFIKVSTSHINGLLGNRCKERRFASIGSVSVRMSSNPMFQN